MFETLLGTNVTVEYATGDPNGRDYTEYYEGNGQRNMPLSHNYSDTGYFGLEVFVYNLIR